MQEMDRRKFPRLLLAHQEQTFKELPGVFLLLPRGGKAKVLDMSYAGIAIPSQGFYDQFSLGDFFECHILFPTEGQLRIPVSLRVVRKNTQIVGLKIDSTSPEGRIKIDQFLKDQIVGSSLRLLNVDILIAAFKANVWYHGAFDTNIFIWLDAPSKIVQKAIVEYDNSLLKYENGAFQVGRSSSSADEAQGYVAPYLAQEKRSFKLSLGKSWVDRLIRLLAQVPEPTKELEAFLELLKENKEKI